MNSPPVLYHYCSTEAFLSIIESKTIRASEFSLSNDAMEGRWLQKIVGELCLDLKLNANEINHLSSLLDDMHGLLGGAGFCLSEEGDMLSQWRAYATNGAGIAIGFNKECFGDVASPLPSVSPVIYDIATQRKLVTGVVERIAGQLRQGAGSLPELMILDDAERKRLDSLNIDFRVSVFSMFPHLYLLKNPAFKEEREWRSVIHVLPVSRTERDERAGSGWTLDDMNYRALNDRIVPYKALPLLSSAIVEVILGPRNITPEKIIEGALASFGLNNVRVGRSKASYR